MVEFLTLKTPSESFVKKVFLNINIRLLYYINSTNYVFCSFINKYSLSRLVLRQSN